MRAASVGRFKQKAMVRNIKSKDMLLFLPLRFSFFVCIFLSPMFT